MNSTSGYFSHGGYMVKFLRLESKRIARSKRFWGAILIGCLIAVLQYMLVASYYNSYTVDWKGIGVRYPQPWYEYWLGGEWYSLFSYIFFMLFPLLAVITQGDSLVSDKASGYSKHMFLRGKKSDYYCARLISSFLSGGIVVIIPLLLSILLCAATSPSILSQAATGTASIFPTSMWSSLYYTHPLVYTFLYLIIDFVYGGLFAAFATSLGSVTRNRFLPLIFPFILYLFSYTLFSSMGIWEYAPFNFLAPAQRVFNISFPIIVGEAVMLIIPTIFLFVWGAKKDETL